MKCPECGIEMQDHYINGFYEHEPSDCELGGCTIQEEWLLDNYGGNYGKEDGKENCEDCTCTEYRED